MFIRAAGLFLCPGHAPIPTCVEMLPHAQLLTAEGDMEAAVEGVDCAILRAFSAQGSRGSCKSQKRWINLWLIFFSTSRTDVFGYGSFSFRNLGVAADIPQDKLVLDLIDKAWASWIWQYLYRI